MSGSEKKKPKSREEGILKLMSMPAVQVIDELESQHDLMTTTAEDYDKWFIQAVRERKEERIQKGYGAIQHPTSRMFEIGIDSIRQGKPSEQFLRLLEKIANKAEDKDVMTLLFPKGFPRRIKKSTVRAAQRDAGIVEDFKNHIRGYLARPRKTIPNGKEGIDAEWEWGEATYAEAIAEYKKRLSPDQQKALDRALRNQGADLLEYRDWLAEEKKKKTTAKARDTI
ncbi:MAG: hypothetical protein NVSMB6_17300 [Burkholderiaceae bacterium]